MAARDVLITEVAAAFSILGLLLVFLPLHLNAVREAEGGKVPYDTLRNRIFQSWLVPTAMTLAAADATLGLVGLWTECEPVAAVAGVLLLILTWCVVVLAGVTVATVT